MNHRKLSDADIAGLAPLLTRALLACARLDGAISQRFVAELWAERARIHGFVQALKLAGLSLGPGDYFRALVGLVGTASWVEQDWRRLSITDHLLQRAQRGLASPVATLSRRLTARSSYFLGPEWLDEREPYERAADAAAEALLRPLPRDGSAPLALAERLHALLHHDWFSGWEEQSAAEHVYRMTGRMPERPWIGWLIAGYMPEALHRAGLTMRPLPCLVPLRPAMRFATNRPADTARMMLEELAAQAEAGLALLDRLEACARAWRRRVAHVTSRSRLDQALALFLILPALTRMQVASALGVTPPGAGLMLKQLVDCDILRRETLSERLRFYVAEESLADFKLQPRQGRHRRPPEEEDVRDSGVLDDLAKAMADLDRLLGADAAEEE